MVDLYYWTPNGNEIVIFLEEAGVPYRIIPVNISEGDQFDPKFLKISPNNRIPAIVDRAPPDGGASLSLFESGVILLYLAEKFRCCLPHAFQQRYTVIQWLMWQVGGLGPMLGPGARGRERI